MSRAGRHAIPWLMLALSLACREHAAYEKPLTMVAVAPVARHAAATGVRYSATVEPAVRLDLAFKTGGYVRTLLQVRGQDGRVRDVQEGDRVAAGAVLATLRESDYLEKRNQARAQLREAEAALAQASQDYERAGRLFAEQSLTRTDYDGARTRAEVTRAKVDGARAIVQEVENALGDASLKAPIDAIVLDRRVEVGTLAGPGMPAFVLADTRRVKVVFGVPDVMLRTMRLGAEERITTASLPGQGFTGQVTLVAPVADPRTRVFDVEVTIPNPTDQLKVGMVASLQLEDTAPSSLVVVGLGSIVRSKDRPDGYAVYVVTDEGGRSIARLRNVTLGEALGNWMAVQDGLAVGERVVTSGASLVIDGEPVRVVPR